jgi:hypothetical protein
MTRYFRFELLTFVNNIAIEIWIGNIFLDQISQCRIVFIYKISKSVIKFSEFSIIYENFILGVKVPKYVA